MRGAIKYNKKILISECTKFDKGVAVVSITVDHVYLTGFNPEG
jgi:hypothetical protein